MKAACPRDKSHSRFLTTAHEVHDWVVDEKGEFVEDRGCSEIAAKPDMGNVWKCKDCGEDAVFVNDGEAE